MEEADKEVRRFNLDLLCSGEPERITSQKASITFECATGSDTVSHLKSKIEDEFQIPKCLMKVELNSAVLTDEERLAQLNVRDGDTLMVRYYSKANCEEINNCIKILQRLLGWLEQWPEGDMEVEEDIPPGQSMFGLLANHRMERALSNLGYHLFLPWLNTEKYANKLYFVAQDGLTLVSKSLEILLSLSRGTITSELQRIEGLLLVILWNITEDAPIRRAVVRTGGVERCTQALLIDKVLPKTRMESLMGNHFFTKETIRKSLGVFANLSELPEIRLTIASNKELLEQMFSITLNPSFQTNVVHSIVMILLVLAYTPETHTHLILHPSFRQFVTNSYRIPEDTLVGKLIRYHLSVLCSILLLVSPHHFTDDDQTMIKVNLEGFLRKAYPRELSHCEENKTIVWDTMTPHIQVLLQSDNHALQHDLRHVCKQTMLLALQTMVHREWHRTVLVKEGMVDFVLCLPWYSDEQLKMEAEKLVISIRGSPDVPYQPPSLLNMCKAAVAVYHCGLHDVMRLSVPELTSKVLV